MRSYLLVFLFPVLFFSAGANAQKDTVLVLYYNLLSFPEGDPGREARLRTINSYLQADILVVNELVDNEGANIILSQSLNVYGADHYSKALFTNGPDSDNMLFYNSSKFTLYSQYIIQTGLRYINEYVLYYNSTDLALGDTIFLYFYSAHLKAGSQPPDEQQRLYEVRKFRERVDNLPTAENIFFGGDLNLYYSGEPAYDTLVNYGVYALNDPLPAGNWHNSYTYRLYHTQSTRTSVFGGGADGGLDDRFDFILFSDDVASGANKMKYMPGSCMAFGNDGNHLNKALVDPPVNPNLPDSVVQALYLMSDHLPVICRLEIEANNQPPVPERLIIAEIMQNPNNVFDSDGEWFEIFNPTGQGIDLNGWYIKDNDYDIHQINTTLVVPAGGFATLGNNADTAVNGNYQCDYQYINFYLSNGADEIILLKPDGYTEVDRVEYDGGVTWPDPTGASMIFIAGVDEDNNIGQNWITAQERELTFSGTSGDKGSPGTNGNGQNLLLEEFMIQVRVFLEGPFQISAMSTALNPDLPLTQPFSVNPWNYNGPEAVTGIPSLDITDWVLIELRDAPDISLADSGSVIARKASFLNKDGYLADHQSLGNPFFIENIKDSLYIVVYHRNHLAVMSSSGMIEIAGVYSWDFTVGSGKATGGVLGHKEVVQGIWAMTGGDGDGNGQTNNGDKNDVWVPQAGLDGYQSGDFNMDGQVNNGDKIEVWEYNTGSGTQVPY
ncbi:MAG: lamin tail domain-containing protein [Bacteroidales bacterium]|nr:lamin tail domain-containing protein [Bacteroidales bacterium]